MLRRRYLNKEEHEGFLTGLYKRNETYLIASTVILLLSILMGYLLSDMVSQLLGNMLKSIKSISRGGTKSTMLSIFMDDIKIGLFIYGGGIFAGIGTVIMLFYSGFLSGYTASKIPLGNSLILGLPYGIFELAGIIVAGAAGFRLASMIINLVRDIVHIGRYMPIGNQLGQIFDANYWELKESITLFVIAAILILIGTFIEVNLATAWGHLVNGLI